MLIVADVHGEADALRRAASTPGPLVVLGDLINMIDYRTNDGIIKDITGAEFVDEWVRLRVAGRWDATHEMWHEFRDRHDPDELRRVFTDRVRAQYEQVCSALEGAEAYVTYGNVDRPDMMREMLPGGVRFVDGEVFEIEGWSVGFAGGGLPSLNTPGEVDTESMRDKLATLRGVDVLCTHVAPAVPELAGDVISGRAKGSRVLLEHLLADQPRYHYFGDVHQPRATEWRIASTRSVNAGYFRATGRGVRLEPKHSAVMAG